MQFVNNVMSGDAGDEDDMLFAVFRKPPADKPFLAMRRVPGVLPQELMYGSALYNAIDWKSTVLLNLAMHARYQLTLTVGGYFPYFLLSDSFVVAGRFLSVTTGTEFPHHAITPAHSCRHDDIVGALQNGSLMIDDRPPTQEQQPSEISQGPSQLGLVWPSHALHPKPFTPNYLHLHLHSHPEPLIHQGVSYET